MKVRSVMEKYGGLRLNRDYGFVAALKGPLVITLCMTLLIQPTFGAAQETRRNPQPSASETSTMEFSSSQPPEELPSAPVPQATSQSPQQSQQPQQQSQQPNTPQPQQPAVGTAAAPYEKPTGVPGSRPAGAAIAPAKQRRVRAIVISLGVILAGAGAIGAIAGMSKASHSQP